MERFHELDSSELSVIIKKGTERPGSGKFLHNTDTGVYVCRRCDLPLFFSTHKFDSGCGWPAFDREFSDSVKKTPDSDGIRTEITCGRCHAHLGHVFLNEGLTPLNLRHCVNSVSLNFVPEFTEKGLENAVFAGGCFWGVEHLMKNQKGVSEVISGYTGGFVVNPTYQEVCTGKTGHVEAVKITFNPAEVKYEDLLKLFFEIHDPTQENRQGPDIGNQYSSAVFCFSEKQMSDAEKIIEILKNKGLEVKTKVLPASIFYDAEDYHQQYYTKTGKTPYCHIRKKIF